MKNYKDAIEYARQRPYMKPTNVLLAFDEAKQINQVLTAGRLRYRLTQKITREEFLAGLKLNAQHSDAVATQGKYVGAKIDVDTTVDIAEPGPEFTHYYRAEPV